MKDAALELMRGEAEPPLHVSRGLDPLLDRSYLAGPSIQMPRIGIAKETIRGEGNAIAQTPAQNVADGHAPSLAQDIQTCEFQRRQHLRPIVIQRCCRVGDEEAHFLQTSRIV